MTCEDVEPDVIPLALVPAKGYSARLPRKNLRPLGGKPLLAWTLEAAKAAGIFPEVWVSSESVEVLDVAREYGALPCERPPELAQPEATIAHVILHARLALEWRGPIYVLAPTNPFRSSFTIAAAWEKCQHLRAGGFYSMSPMPHPPEWAFRFEPISGTITPIIPELIDKPRAALPRSWRPDGAHMILGETKGPALGFESDPIEAVDINTADDLAYAEYLLETGRVPWVPTHSAPKKS